MTDITTKILMALIVVALLLNAVALSTTPAQAQLASIRGSDGAMESIARDLRSIARGSCANIKIC